MNKAFLRKAILILTACLLFGSGKGQEKSTTLTYLGKAQDQKTGTYLFTAHFTEKRLNGKLISMETWYEMPGTEGKVAQRKCVFNETHPYSPSVVFENFRSGHLEILEQKPGFTRAFYRSGKNVAVKKKDISKTGEPWVADAGLLELIKDRWNSLQKGEKVDLNIVVPSRLEYYRFQLSKNQSESNKQISVIYFESFHWFIRQLVAPIILTFRNSDGRLLRYQGTTNLSDAQGNLLMNALITYHFDN